MLEIIQSVIVTPNLDELLKLIHEALKKVVYAENCFVALYDKQSGLFNRPFYVDQHSTNSPPERLKKSCTAYVYRTGNPLLMTQDVFQKLLAADEVELVGTPSPSWLGVPLKTPTDTIGVLVVQHYEDENAYSERDLEFLSSVAGQIALAIERKRTEFALRKSELRLRAILESALDCVITMDHEGKVVDWNPAAEKTFGYTSEEAAHKEMAELIIPLPLRERHRQGLKRYLATGQGPTLGKRLELSAMRADGTELPVELAISHIDLQGTPMFTGYLRDITERKRVEEALQDANRRAITEYKSLVERIAALGQSLGHARDLTLILRAVRDFSVISVPCDGLVVSLYDQEKAERRAVFCWADETELEPTIIQHIPVGDGLASQAIKSGTTIIDNNLQENITNRTLAIGDCQNDKMPRSALYAPMTIMGRTVGCIEVQSYQLAAFTQEHTTAMQMAANLAANAIENVQLLEREREKEQQLLQSQKMEAVGQLAGGVAHDFNNLLTVITGYSDLALKRIEEGSPLRRNIEEIKKAGGRAASLTRQLLAFSRRQMLQAKVFDINSVVADVDTMLRRLIGEDIDFVTLLKPGIGRIKADPGQIEQVLMNLVVNARDAMPRGGKLTVETGQVYLDETYTGKHQSVQSGHYVMLAVTDTGLGMDADTQKRIFEPFFTTKALGKGTGLGLSTVYGIVKQSGGYSWVFSEPGRGTTFKIYLPRIEDVVDIVVEAPEEESHGSETVLLVEDEEMVRELAKEILQGSGYDVLVAANGEEAQRICHECPGKIDLMITDVVMPQMSGRELAERIGVFRSDTRVLYMSGYTDDAIVRHGVLDDNMFFLQKPFTPDGLTAKVREVLGSVPA
jgi:PAS domain S-box-containing protein